MIRFLMYREAVGTRFIASVPCWASVVVGGRDKSRPYSFATLMPSLYNRFSAFRYIISTLTG